MQKTKLKKNTLFAWLVLLLVVILGGGLLLWRAQGKNIPPPPPKASNGARIFFAPALVSLNTGSGKKSVDLVVDSGGNPIGQVTVRLSYDPKVLSDVHMTAADFSKANFSIAYQLTQGAIDPTRGQIYAGFAVLPARGTITPKSVKIATITFTVLKKPAPDQQLFSFLPLTAVYGPTVGRASFSVGTGTGKPSAPPPPKTSILQIVEPLKSQ